MVMHASDQEEARVNITYTTHTHACMHAYIRSLSSKQLCKAHTLMIFIEQDIITKGDKSAFKHF
jgi:hypothetical protein